MTRLDAWSCGAVFRRQSARRRRGRVVAYDRLGFGRSDVRTERLPSDFISDEGTSYLPNVLEQLKIDRFVVLGHSVGGGMAIAAAARYPRACTALVTIAAQVFVEGRTLKGILGARELFADPAQVGKLMKYHGEKTRWVLDAWIDTWLDPTFADWTLSSVLPGVKCPVLVIHGELDEYGSSQHPDLIGGLSEGPANVRILPGLGHLPQRENQGLVVGLVANFLAASCSTA